MASRWWSVVVDCTDIGAQSRFWAEVLDYRVVFEGGAVLRCRWA